MMYVQCLSIVLSMGKDTVPVSWWCHMTQRDHYKESHLFSVLCPSLDEHGSSSFTLTIKIISLLSSRFLSMLSTCQKKLNLYVSISMHICIDCLYHRYSTFVCVHIDMHNMHIFMPTHIQIYTSCTYAHTYVYI